jgi:hypothetical protein
MHCKKNRLGESAKQKLASDINVAIMNTAAAQGTLVVPIAAAAGDYDDISLCDTIMNEQGVPDYDRFLGLSSRDYNGLAGNLSQASRSFGNAKSDKAYERNFVGMVAGFDTYKFDYANRITAAAGGTPPLTPLALKLVCSSSHFNLGWWPDQRGQPLPNRYCVQHGRHSSWRCVHHRWC